MNHWGHHKQSQTHTSTYLTLSAIALGGFNFSNYCLVQQGDNSSAKGLLLLWHCSGWDSLIDLSNPAALLAVHTHPRRVATVHHIHTQTHFQFQRLRKR